MFYFLIKKLLTRVPYIPVSGWHLRHLGSACDVAQLPILTIHRLPRCVVVLSFTWCGIYSLVMVELSPMIDLFLFFSFLSLSWQLKCTIVLFVCYFSISVLILWISYFVLIPFIEVFFFNFVIQLQFLICFIFISVLIFLISYFVFIPFIVSVLLNSSLFFVGISESILFVLILVIFCFVWVIFIYNLVLQF